MSNQRKEWNIVGSKKRKGEKTRGNMRREKTRRDETNTNEDNSRIREDIIEEKEKDTISGRES